MRADAYTLRRWALSVAPSESQELAYLMPLGPATLPLTETPRRRTLSSPKFKKG